MDPKRLKIAIHEVGHAVIALICRHGVSRVSLKEMSSPRGSDNYLGSTTLETNGAATKLTGEKAIQRVMISLGGYASEILFSGGSVNIGGDDLTVATELTEGLLQNEEFRNWVATLPNPSSPALQMLENPLVRAYIDRKICECVETLAPLKPVIQLIARELLKKDELTGDEVAILLDSALREMRVTAQRTQF